MKTLLQGCLVVLCMACHKSSIDTILPEYDDWYVLRSPNQSRIEAVWGDIDKAVMISTYSGAYRTENRGKTWSELSLCRQAIISGLVNYKDTVLACSGLSWGPSGSYPQNPVCYSVDAGKTWLTPRRPSPAFDSPAARASPIWINPVTASNGTKYTISYRYLDDSTKSTRRFTNPGVVTQTGRRIDVPTVHQFVSLALDDKGRLYIAGSDEICNQGSKSPFCNGGRGVVYVSKRAHP